MAEFGSGQPFEENTFDQIYATYFEDLIAEKRLAADPSGWARTEPGAHVDLRAPMPPQLLGHYIVDNRKLIAPQKETLRALFSAWDACDYGMDDVTLVPSISAASLAVLMLLRAQNVRCVVFESPAYYAVMDQAEAFGLETKLIATYSSDEYRWQASTWSAKTRGACAFWLTQPRYALGINQNVTDVEALFADMQDDQFLIIDETADQCWPSIMSGFRTGLHQRLIKIRGVMKPLGLNGLRLASIMHAPVWRRKFQEYLWLVGAVLDRYSLIAGAEIAQTPQLFSTLLQSARQKVASARRSLTTAALGAPLVVSPMENGYLGVVEIDWRGARARPTRSDLLSYCREIRMPVTLGPAMIFARDEWRERVRLNYFMPRRDLDYCIARLSEFAKGAAL
jgi:DNA-binding transcriptional MocR family regulator